MLALWVNYKRNAKASEVLMVHKYVRRNIRVEIFEMRKAIRENGKLGGSHQDTHICVLKYIGQQTHHCKE